MTIAIKAENISKQYRLGYVGSGSLKDDARRWWARMRGKEDPLLTIGETNDRSTKAESDYVWALKDINFEIEQGDTVGIIGRNGAGKSTLLKILSKVTAPTTGNIKVKGRIASLLEVGTGFHGELTGRENIYLNGAIMGMRKHEITRKLDEIVDFAGVERYLDTPVKRYSSGMYVRLGFAVAAHLENEILIVDEVLAVGDAEFQKKCLGKLGDVSQGEGRTVLFVTHNMASIAQLCKTGLLLLNGEVQFQSNDVLEVISKYHNNDSNNEVNFRWDRGNNIIGDGYYRPEAFYFTIDGEVGRNVNIERGKRIKFVISFYSEAVTNDLEIHMAILKDQETVFETQQTDSNPEMWPKIKKGNNTLFFELDTSILNLGEYEIVNSAYLYQKTVIIDANSNIQPKINFNIIGKLSESPYWQKTRQGLIAPELIWYSSSE